MSSTIWGCKGVLTKAPIYAVERIKVIQKVGFLKSKHLLIGKTGYAYAVYCRFTIYSRKSVENSLCSDAQAKIGY